MEFLNDLEPLLRTFWYISLFSSLLFVIQTIMTLTGSDAIDGMDADFDSDFDDSTSPFQLFSFRNLVNFLIGFGWTGVSFYDRIESHTVLISIAAIIGLVFVALFFIIIRQVQKLAEDNSFKLSSTIDKTGEVYLNIPEKNSGKGKILISINGSMRELAAITSGDKLFKGTIVRVVKIEADNLISVEPI